MQECLPVIGNCQISSILSNLDNTIPVPGKIISHTSDPTTTMDLIVLDNNDYKVTIQNDNSGQLPNNYILLKENTNNNNSTSPNDDVKLKESPKKIRKGNEDDFENMLYFVCNLCPYLCINDAKIMEHLEMEHKVKGNAKPLQLKCPACPNIFYHKISLRSHLLHDHKVGNSDLRRIIQAVVYFSKKSLQASNIPELDPNEAPASAINGKMEMDRKYIEKLMNTKKIIQDESDAPNDISDLNVTVSSDDNLDNLEKLSPISTLTFKEPERISENELITDVVSLPTMDITHNDAAKTFSTIIKKKSDMLTKYLVQKKLIKCTFGMCKVRFQDITKLNYHIKCHTEDCFMCPECKGEFGLWKTLTGHLWRVHKVDMELYACDKCDYKTFSLGKLNNMHKLIHSDIKSFICGVCQKGFKNSKQLRNHKITHKEKTDKLTHKCDICTKVFYDRRQLRIHMDRVHKKIKPFLCNYCGYKGSSKSALKLHIRQHTGNYIHYFIFLNVVIVVESECFNNVLMIYLIQ